MTNPTVEKATGLHIYLSKKFGVVEIFNVQIQKKNSILRERALKFENSNYRLCLYSKRFLPENLAFSRKEMMLT